MVICSYIFKRLGCHLTKITPYWPFSNADVCFHPTMVPTCPGLVEWWRGVFGQNAWFWRWTEAFEVPGDDLPKPMELNSKWDWNIVEIFLKPINHLFIMKLQVLRSLWSALPDSWNHTKKKTTFDTAEQQLEHTLTRSCKTMLPWGTCEANDSLVFVDVRSMIW